jgi:hypothetical protein
MSLNGSPSSYKSEILTTKRTSFIHDLQKTAVAEVMPPATFVIHMTPAERSRALVANPAELSRHIDPPHVPLGSLHEPLH